MNWLVTVRLVRYLLELQRYAIISCLNERQKQLKRKGCQVDEERLAPPIAGAGTQAGGLLHYLYWWQPTRILPPLSLMRELF